MICDTCGVAVAKAAAGWVHTDALPKGSEYHKVVPVEDRPRLAADPPNSMERQASALERIADVLERRWPAD